MFVLHQICSLSCSCLLVLKIVIVLYHALVYSYLIVIVLYRVFVCLALILFEFNRVPLCLSLINFIFALFAISLVSKSISIPFITFIFTIFSSLSPPLLFFILKSPFSPPYFLVFSPQNSPPTPSLLPSAPCLFHFFSFKFIL